MKYKEYSKDIWDRIEHSLDQVLQKDPRPVAAFDADGTLWDIDLGENFFQYQIEKKLVPLPTNAWDHYHELKRKNDDPREAYLWLAQINQGLPLEKVRAWAAIAVENCQPLPVFLEQQKLIHLLLKKNVEVFIVTASVKWAVEPGAKILGVDADHVLGVATQTQNDVITSQQDGVITYRQGKVDALLSRTGGKAPFLCSGNTMGDFQLMKAATHLAIAVSAASREEALFATETELQQHAQKNSWATHRFV